MRRPTIDLKALFSRCSLGYVVFEAKWQSDVVLCGHFGLHQDTRFFTLKAANFLKIFLAGCASLKAVVKSSMMFCTAIEIGKCSGWV